MRAARRWEVGVAAWLGLGDARLRAQDFLSQGLHLSTLKRAADHPVAPCSRRRLTYLLYLSSYLQM